MNIFFLCSPVLQLLRFCPIRHICSAERQSADKLPILDVMERIFYCDPVGVRMRRSYERATYSLLDCKYPSIKAACLERKKICKIDCSDDKSNHSGREKGRRGLDGGRAKKNHPFCHRLNFHIKKIFYTFIHTMQRADFFHSIRIYSGALAQATTVVPRRILDPESLPFQYGINLFYT